MHSERKEEQERARGFRKRRRQKGSPFLAPLRT